MVYKKSQKDTHKISHYRKSNGENMEFKHMSWAVKLNPN